MIDLHIHSTHSDGKDSVVEILKKAQKKNLSCISITDHNTCTAYQELKKINVKDYYEGKIITGIELNTKVLGIPIELLGYKINPEIMQENLKGIYLSAEDRNRLEIKRLYESLLKFDIKIPSNFIENYSLDKYASQYLYETITKDEYNKKFIDSDAWEDSLVLYRKYMSDPESPFFIDMNDVLPNIESIVKLIKKANGKVFIPHIFEYKHNSEKILKYILENFDIDGIECYYSSFTKEQTDKLLKLCKNKNFLISGGSDYHGISEENKTDIGSGRGDLEIPDSIISKWL